MLNLGCMVSDRLESLHLYMNKTKTNRALFFLNALIKSLTFRAQVLT